MLNGTWNAAVELGDVVMSACISLCLAADITGVASVPVVLRFSDLQGSGVLRYLVLIAEVDSAKAGQEAGLRIALGVSISAQIDACH